MQDFRQALDEDRAGRAAEIRRETEYLLENEEQTGELVRMLESGIIPYRVTHNDTKINNVLFDTVTDRAICVIDLDTVMPGLTANDFGDSIRFGASTALEDEQDLSKVSCDLHLFDVYARGFIEGCGGALTDLEIDMLPMGAILMTFALCKSFLPAPYPTFATSIIWRVIIISIFIVRGTTLTAAGHSLLLLKICRKNCRR